MITYKNSLEGIDSNQLKGFFVGWKNPPSAKTHLDLLRNSFKVVLAVDDKTKSIVGFITAISDRILSAYIPFLEVLLEYQNQGIGSELMRRMIKELGGLYMIDLTCDSEFVEFYKRFGMEKAVGMILRNYDKQSGK